MTPIFPAANFLAPEETARIAEDLAAKYGKAALDFARQRAARAETVGEETGDLLGRSPWCYVS